MALRRVPTTASILVCLVLATCSRPGPEPAASGGGAETPDEAGGTVVDRLREIAATVDPRAYPYANSARARTALEEAERLPAGPAQFRALIRTALEEIRAGLPEQALGTVDRAGALIRGAGVEVPPDTRVALLQLRGIAGLRLAEQQNCVDGHTVESCLLPIRGEGVHRIEDGSRAAIGTYRELLELRPQSAAFRWLLNLAHMTLGEYPDGVPADLVLPADLFRPADEPPVGEFREIGMAAGAAVVGLSGGAVTEDLDGDGRLDLVASSWGLADPLRLFLQTEDGRFEDRTAGSGLEGQLGGLNLTHADVDGDGDADLMVLRGAWLFDQGLLPDSLLRNEGGGRFVDVTRSAGLYRERPTHSAAWGDFDNDGHLDVFVGAESTRTRRFPCELFRNRGDGTFVDVAAEAGVDAVGIVKAAAWGDVDGDGLLDLYLSRFGSHNVLFRNLGPDGEGRWRFEDVTDRAGVAEPVQSFPAWFFDADQDGDEDLFVASFASFTGDSLEGVVRDVLGLPGDAPRPRLYLNRGDGTFDDATTAFGLDRAVLAMGANFGDFDNDGWLDLYLGTGEPALSTLVPNLALRNVGGRRFEDVTWESRLGSLQKGHGVAFGDLDGDGDQDLYVTMGGAYEGDVYPNLLFENPGHGNAWVTLRFAGTESNRFGVGSRVRLEVATPGGPRTIHRTVGTGGSFGSSSLQLEVGLGEATSIERIVVRWHGSGRLVDYGAAPRGRILLLEEGADRPRALPDPG